MKKAIIVIIFFSLFISYAYAQCNNSANCQMSNFEKEDPNKDGVVDLLDLFFIVKEIKTNSANQLADINGDNVINILDLIKVVKKISHDPNPPPQNPNLPSHAFQFSDACVAPVRQEGDAILPQVIVDTSMPEVKGNTIEVREGDDFQAALDAANPGDEIVLEAGATFQGNFILRNKGGNDWIIIRSSEMDQLPPEGVRVSPDDAVNMPRLMAKGSSSVLSTEKESSYYRFIGIEMVSDPDQALWNLVYLGDPKEPDVSKVPHHFVFDRVYVHPHVDQQGTRAFAFNARHAAIINSYVSDWKHDYADSQAILSWSTPGPLRVVNNFLEGAGENIMFGGANNLAEELQPQDVEICGNHFYKPPTWKANDKQYSVKNLFELKMGKRILLSGNIFENNWADSQDGTAFLLRSAGNMPWLITEHITIAYNVIRNSPNAVNIANLYLSNENQGKDNSYKLVHNIFEEISGRRLSILRGVDYIQYKHNTVTSKSEGSLVFFDIGKNNMTNENRVEGFVYQDNIATYGKQGIIGSGRSKVLQALEYYTAGDHLIENNVIIGEETTNNPYPAKNIFVSNSEAIGFEDYENGKFSLSGSSPFKGAASDGLDMGADVEFIEKLTLNIKSESINRAPVAKIAKSKLVSANSEIILKSLTYDDGLSKDPLTLKWTQISGPNQVSIRNSQTSEATATLTEPGAYVFELEADDGEYQDKNTVTYFVDANKYSINFQPTASETPAGFLKDDGNIYDSDLGYGWDKSVKSWERFNHEDQKLDTLARSANNKEAVWSFDIPNGNYLVSLASGDASWDQESSLISIEGVVAIDKEPSTKGNFLNVTDFPVTIEDNQLNIVIGGNGISNTRINYVTIKKVES